MKINDKIALLREEMKQHGMSAYIIPSSDAHMSEYVATHWQGRAYLSGFTGSAGTLVVTLTESGLWTDGRYFIQAEHELNGSEIKLFRIAQPNVPTINEYLVRVLNEGEMVGLEMCKFFKRQYGDNFISCMPTNLYGPNDNFDLKNSHVLPALIRKFHEAKVNGSDVVEVWGTGTPLREFIYVDDMAAACIFLMENYDGEQHVNIGTGEEVSIRQLAETVKEVIGFEGELVFNTNMPDGTPRKLTTVDKLHELGFMHKVTLNEGIRMAYEWFLENYK